jgi:hypothetical protein
VYFVKKYLICQNELLEKEIYSFNAHEVFKILAGVRWRMISGG